MTSGRVARACRSIGYFLPACATAALIIGAPLLTDAAATDAAAVPARPAQTIELIPVPTPAPAPAATAAPAPTVAPTPIPEPTPVPAADGSSLVNGYPALAGGELAVAVGDVPELGDMGVYTEPVYLTFDDGPWPEHTEQVLELLDEYNAQATFFVVGRNVNNFKSIAQDIVARGHALGNHTHGHGLLPTQSDHDATLAIGTASAAIHAATGVWPTCLRPPEGQLDQRTAGVVAGQGLRLSMWDVDSLDWLVRDASRIAATVIEQTEPGSTVLLHDGGGDRTATVEALRVILEALTARGMRFEALPACV